MADDQVDTIARKLARLLSRRDAARTFGAAGAGTAFGPLRLNGAAARKKRKKGKGKGKGEGKKKCNAPKRKCGRKCVSLTSTANCGCCGNRCGGGESCTDGLCCAAGEVNCRGACSADCPASVPSRPFPVELGYGAIQPSGASNSDVTRAYDRWKSRYLVAAGATCGGTQYRVAFGKPGTADHKQTVSEGQGYGMVIVAHMAEYDPDAQEIFDGLVRFVLAHPSNVDDRLMDWKVPESKEGNDSAFDGDADIAYGLLLADAQWGSSSGPIDYRAEFERVLAGIKTSTIGNVSHLPLLGDWVGQATSGEYTQYSPRTSDFMPGHFRAFGRADNAGFWDDVVGACADAVESLQANYSPDTGLLPDFAVRESLNPYVPKPAPPNFLEDVTDGDYTYNACRDPWRLGVSALLNGDDAASKAQAVKISQWADVKTNGDPTVFHSGYRLSGAPLPGTDYFSTAFVAPLGVAAMNDPAAQAWLDAIYDAVRNVQDNYFEDSINLLCLLVMTGNFWDPTQ